MKLSNKLKITLLMTFCMFVLCNLKAFAVTGVITEITVNMRKEPSTSSKKIMYVTQDYKVEVLEKVGEWYKIKYNGVTGYVFGKYVDVDDSKLEEKEEVKTPIETEENKQEEKKDTDENIQDVTTDTKLELQIKKSTNVRLIPNITSNIIYTSKKDISINVLEQIGVWSYISVDNIYGWVRTDNIIEKNAHKNDVADEKEEDKVTITEREVAYIKYDTVNLRKKASTSSTVLAKLKLNNEVIVLEKVNSKWTKVEYDGLTGYVSADLLSDNKQEENDKKETTSRDGETVSREDEQENKKDETKKEEDNSNVKEEIISNKDTEIKVENNKNEENKESVKEDKETTTESNKEKEEDKEINKEDIKEETSNSKEEIATDSKTKGKEIAEFAKKYVGYDYVLGGASPKKGFDCSGLTYYVYKQFGYTISRTSKTQAKDGKEVSKDELQPGDLLIFKNQSLTSIGHVGIYIGNNKMVHASEPGVGVVITDLDARGYNYNKRFVTARRIV